MVSTWGVSADGVDAADITAPDGISVTRATTSTEEPDSGKAEAQGTAMRVLDNPLSADTVPSVSI